MFRVDIIAKKSDDMIWICGRSPSYISSFGFTPPEIFSFVLGAVRANPDLGLTTNALTAEARHRRAMGKTFMAAIVSNQESRLRLSDTPAAVAAACIVVDVRTSTRKFHLEVLKK